VQVSEFPSPKYAESPISTGDHLGDVVLGRDGAVYVVTMTRTLRCSSSHPGRNPVGVALCVLSLACQQSSETPQQPSGTPPLGLAGSQAPPTPRAIHLDRGTFVDEAGAIVVFRGLNIATDSKVPPFRPLEDPTLLDPLRTWGINLVRLLFSWEAFEPEPDRYDQTYLDYLARVIDACEAQGARVIVDVHQDAFSRSSIGGCGDGFPRWALPPDVAIQTPDNGPNCSSWGTQMIFDLNMHRSWAAFYANEQGVRDRYLAMLDAIATRFGSHANVLGFDLLNEPWGDEGLEVGPLYEDAARTVRARAPSAVLFVSPHALTSSGLDTELPRPRFENFVYSPHYYDGAVLLLGTWMGADLTPVFDRMQRVAADWNAPLFLGEFGAPANTQGGLDYIDAVYAQLDQRFASGGQWGFAAHWNPTDKDGWNGEDLSIVDGASAIRANYRVRPFAPRIAGTPTSFEVQFADRERAERLELRWDHAPNAGATRVFLAPSTTFGGAPRLELEGEQLACAMEPDGLYVTCESPIAGPKTLRVLP
jgi:endoglycosylceramidase